MANKTARKPVRNSRPITTLLDVLGKRWTLRILWELRDVSLSFRALRKAAGEVSPSVLNQRLAELRQFEIVDLDSNGYALTRPGRALGAVLLKLDAWAKTHLR